MLDVLAGRYRAAFDKIKAGREQWIEGTLELAAVIKEARRRLPADQDFSRWIERNDLRKINKDARGALLHFAADPIAARALLENTTRNSWEMIWRESKGKLPNRLRVPSAQNPRTSSVFRRTRRERRIPDVMQDKPPPRPAPILKSLTREQVDPDFKGTPLQFATKYGHVNLHTKEEIEHNKRQEALSVWLGAVSEFERTGRAALTALAAIDPATLDEWMAKPAKVEKFRAWCKSILLAHEALAQKVRQT